MKNGKLSYIFEKALVISIIFNKCDNKDEKIFKEKESTDMLIILDSVNNTEKYQKDKHDQRKRKSRI